MFYMNQVIIHFIVLIIYNSKYTLLGLHLVLNHMGEDFWLYLNETIVLVFKWSSSFDISLDFVKEYFWINEKM